MYKDKNLSPEIRAKDLLSKMTIDEKIDQMVFFPNINKLMSAVSEDKDVPCASGTFGNLNNLDDIESVDKIQDYYKNKTRLGIPLIVTFEALHGLFDNRATGFPQCAGIGGSFNKELVRKMAKIIGDECNAVGIRQVFAPNVDIPRENRWGRTQEAYGEDPYLVGEMGVEYVKGIQEKGVAATAKHYIAYGMPEGGINLAPAHIGEREIREVLLEPFKKCIDAGVASVMPAYNEVDGEPIHASKKYLNDILRDELGFKGTTISDWGGVHMLKDFQFVAKDFIDAGKMAINAGLDIEAPDPKGYGEEFRNAVKNGEIDEKLIDDAVLRILKFKFEYGIFDNPFSDMSLRKKMNSDEAKKLSREIDEQSILLLKNDGILPLDEKKLSKVAVIGNNAKHSYLGNYIGAKENCVSFYDGMVNRLGENRVLYAKGCNHISCTDEGINEAVEKAKMADIVFLCLGDSTDTGGDIGGGAFNNKEITCGEGYDRHNLDFMPSQQRLFDEIIKLGKPTILILYAGRPYAIEKDVEKVNGFMFSWGGGEQNGIAFANLIFGDKSPSARLSFSFPHSVGHLPCYYNYKVTARGSYYKRHGKPDAPGRDYVLSSPNAWMPFGYGLSYTTIEYSDLVAQLLDNGNVKVNVTVENKGKYEINESVLVFVKMMCCPITPFVKKLRKFDKVYLKPGDKKTVEFTLTSEDFTYIDHNMKTQVNKGEHKILVENLECTINI